MKSIKLLSCCCLLLFILASCRKDEFMAAAEGQRVPHEELTITLKEVLDASPYTLFKAAWKRSEMDQILQKKGNKAPYTLLVPTDAAFIADGLTLEVINSTTPALLDSILLYHTLSGAVDPDELKTREERYQGKTLLENPYLTVKPAIAANTAYETYAYLQYLKVTGGTLFINGKTAGNIAPVKAKDGLLMPIDHVLHKPTKTILQVLQEDGRFGMYLELNTRTDLLYTELSEYAYPRDFTYGLTLSIYANYNISFTSIFAIPDDVFHKAGFNTVDDILALNDRNPLPYLDYNTFMMVGGLATDTLIAYHRWAALFSPMDTTTGEKGSESPDNFYSNDLTNALLSNFEIVNSGFSGTLPSYINPLDFSSEGGKVKVKVKGSDYPAATITEPDINTLMGPVHVVDHLILPKGFKL